MSTRKLNVLVSLVVTLGIVLTACQPQVIEVEKEVVVEKVIEKAVEVKVEAAPEIAYVEVEKIVEVEKVVEVVVTAEPAPDDETVTLTVTQWHTMEEQFEGPFMQIVEAFEAANSDVKVDVVGLSWMETTPQLTIRTAGGNPPDIALVNGGDPAIFAAMGALEPIEGLVPQQTLDDMQWASGALLDIPSYQGELFGLTWYAFTFPMLYNKVVMDAAGLDSENPPRTWDELLDAMVQVGDSGDDLIGLGGDFTSGAWAGKFYYRFLWAHGADTLDEDGNVVFDSPEAIAALEELVDVYGQSERSIGFGTGAYAAREIFARDKVAFLNEAAWMRSILRDLSGQGEAYDAMWGVAPWPGGYTYTASHVWVVFKQSKNKEAAGRFINFVVTDRDMQELWSEVFGSIPPQQQYQDFELFEDPFFDEFLAGLENGKGEMPHTQGDLIASYVAVAFQEALSGISEPADALKRAANNTRIALGQATQ